jgi:hypothetical protein
MELGDIDGDGKPELVTGKILFPHQGRDPGEFDPLFIFWYKMEKGVFERHVLSYNNLQWYPEQTQNPAPNGAIGMGRKFVIADLDGDGKTDIIVASNTGLYVFYGRGMTPSPRPAKNPLPPNNTYPTNMDRGSGRGGPAPGRGGGGAPKQP